MTKKEAARARAWREALGLTVDQLVDLSGYSRSAIFWFEKGESPPNGRGTGEPGKINSYVWQRYKLVCQAVEVQLKSGKGFDW